MDQFRLILLGIGVALLLLIYYVSRRSIVKPTLQPRKRIPLSGDVSPPERPYQAAMEVNKPKRHNRKRYVKFLGGGAAQNPVTQNLYKQSSTIEPFTVTVYVMPLAGVRFRRDQVIHCLVSMGCVPRSDEYYDYLILDDTSGKRVNRLFTMHDVHEHGIFSHDPDAPASTNGLVFEMGLPAPMENVMAFEKLLDVARIVATKLNGVVCDDLQNRLTRQATTHIKDKIMDYNRKLRFGSAQSLQ